MLPSLLLLCKPRQLVVQPKVWFNPSRIISDKGLGGLPLLGWQHHANYRAEPSLSLTSFPQKIASSSPGRLGAWLLNNDDSTGWVETIKSMSAPQAASPRLLRLNTRAAQTTDSFFFCCGHAVCPGMVRASLVNDEDCICTVFLSHGHF